MVSAQMIDSTGFVGMIFNYLTINVTGDVSLTCLMIVVVLLLVGLVFRLPLELISVAIFPVVIVMMAYVSEFLGIGGFVLIFLGLVLARNFFFK